MDIISKVAVKYEQDLPLVRQRAQQISRLAGLSTHDQTRLTAAVSEIARNAFQYAGGGFVEFGILREQAMQFLRITVRDQGPGIAKLNDLLRGDQLKGGLSGNGLVGAQKLVDRFSITSEPGQGTQVHLGIRIPPNSPPITTKIIGEWVAKMAQEAPRTPLQEIQEQNQELVQLLDQLRQNEEALKQQLDEIRRLEQVRDDLIHTMVHDLRNPLSIIYASLSGLVSDPTVTLGSNQGEMLEIAVMSTKKMVRLVTNILDVSRLENNQLSLDYVEVSLMDLVCEVIREQSPLAAFKNVQLKQEVDVTLPLVQLDPELMNRVFQNLIDNALKFTPQGGLIQISARAGRPEDQRKVQLSEPFICIKVSDNGPGIPEETRERLFDKFVTGKHRQTGSGLGLTFCKLAVEAHGGEIYVESEPDQGTDFVLTIPYQMPEHASS